MTSMGPFRAGHAATGLKSATGFPAQCDERVVREAIMQRA